MARKPRITTQEPILKIELRPDAADAANSMAVVQASYAQGRDLVNQLLGQAQLAGAFEQFSRTVSVSKLAVVKENKLYQQLSGMRTPNGSELKGTWEEFCNLLGMSVDKADLDIKNLQSFGEEALEAMGRAGIGYRDMRQFRRLPVDQKTALIEAAKSGDKDALLELAEDLIAKHDKETAALAKRAEATEADLEARARVLEDKNAKIDQLAEEMAKLKKRVAAMPPADVGEQIRMEVVQATARAEVGIRALCAGFSALAEHTERHGISHGDFMSGQLGQLELAVLQLRDTFDIKESPTGDEMPDWVRPGAMEAVLARTAPKLSAAGRECNEAEQDT